VWFEIEHFIEALLEKYGLWRVLTGPFLVIAVVGGFGLITNRGAASIVAVSFGYFIATVLILYFALKWRSADRQASERARSLTEYAERTMRQNKELSFSITEWDEKAIISKNGDTIIERRITLEVGAQDLHSCWTANYSTSGGELSAREKHEVLVQARSISESGELGARYDLTDSWEGTKQRIYIHFERPAPSGSTVRIWVRWSWPAFFRHLLRGGVEQVEWNFHRPMRSLSATMTFDSSCRLKSLFPVTSYPNCPAPTQERNNPDGSLEIRATYNNVAEDTTVGFRLDGSQARS
jgi:hypothetical protein